MVVRCLEQNNTREKHSGPAAAKGKSKGKGKINRDENPKEKARVRDRLALLEGIYWKEDSHKYESFGKGKENQPTCSNSIVRHVLPVIVGISILKNWERTKETEQFCVVANPLDLTQAEEDITSLTFRARGDLLHVVSAAKSVCSRKLARIGSRSSDWLASRNVMFKSARRKVQPWESYNRFKLSCVQLESCADIIGANMEFARKKAWDPHKNMYKVKGTFHTCEKSSDYRTEIWVHYKLSHHDIVRVGEVHPSLDRAIRVPVPGHLRNAIGRPMLGLGSLCSGHRIEELSVTDLLMRWYLEFAIGCPTPSKGHRVCEVLLKLPQMAHGSQTCTLSLFHVLSKMETLPSSVHKGSPFVRTVKP